MGGGGNKENAQIVLGGKPVRLGKISNVETLKGPGKATTTTTTNSVIATVVVHHRVPCIIGIYTGNVTQRSCICLNIEAIMNIRS